MCVTPDPCEGVECTDIPASSCNDDTLTSYWGGCVSGECEYPGSDVDCADTGLVCNDGACEEPVVPPTTCESYCTTQAANCAGGDAITFAVDCATDCATWTEGVLGDEGNDTAHCRLYHATAAAGNAALHCPHAGPDGGGVCVDPTPTWDADIQPIVTNYCSGCHKPVGTAGSWSTTSYEDTQKDSYHCMGLTKGACFSVRIKAGTMPTTGSVLAAVQMSGELDLIDAWIAGGMPEN
jgi:hypothetical protein